MDVRALYQQTIMEHARAPRHASMPDAADTRVRRDNPLCGDRVDVGVRLEGDVIAEIGVVARGCALCVASGSMMSERAVRAEAASLRRLADQFAGELEPRDGDDDGDDGAGDGDGDGLGDLTAFRGVRAFASRKRCALLPWQALLAALDEVARKDVS